MANSYVVNKQCVQTGRQNKHLQLQRLEIESVNFARVQSGPRRDFSCHHAVAGQILSSLCSSRVSVDCIQLQKSKMTFICFSPESQGNMMPGGIFNKGCAPFHCLLTMVIFIFLNAKSVTKFLFQLISCEVFTSAYPEYLSVAGVLHL